MIWFKKELLKEIVVLSDNEKMLLLEQIALSKCEEMILWAIYNFEGKPSVYQILNLANEIYKKNWKIQTVHTFIDCLIKKGYISFYRFKGVRYFIPLISKDEYRNMLLGDVVKKYYDNEYNTLMEDVRMICKNIDLGCFLLRIYFTLSTGNEKRAPVYGFLFFVKLN